MQGTKINGKLINTDMEPIRCHALRFPILLQSHKLSLASEKYPTNTVEAPSASWPEKIIRAFDVRKVSTSVKANF